MSTGYMTVLPAILPPENTKTERRESKMEEQTVTITVKTKGDPF